MIAPWEGRKEGTDRSPGDYSVGSPVHISLTHSLIRTFSLNLTTHTNVRSLPPGGPQRMNRQTARKDIKELE